MKPTFLKQSLWTIVLAIGCAGLSGCTLNALGGPTLSTTTSAEQTQRLFWENVKQGKWQTVQALLLPNITWRNGSRVLSREQILPYLKQLQVKDYLLTDVTVKPNSNEMTVVYRIQITTASSSQPLNLSAVAVWQQLPPLPTDATKKQKKQAAKAAPYLLSVEDLVPDSPAVPGS